MRFFSLLFLALFFVACGDANRAAEATEAEMEETAAEMSDAADDMGDRMGDAATSLSASGASYVQATVQAVRDAGGDITNLSPQTAVENIEGWINRLGNIDGTESIREELGNLQMELQSGNIDGSKVGGMLSSLAAKTRAAGDGNMALNGLASALEAGANKLGGK